jgi:hypothetical protein
MEKWRVKPLSIQDLVAVGRPEGTNVGNAETQFASGLLLCMETRIVPIPDDGKWEDQPFVVVAGQAKAAARMASTTTWTRRTPVQGYQPVTGRSMSC